MKITPSTNTTQRTNIINMVEPFPGPAAWPCQFQPTHPRVPLQTGADKGGAKGLNYQAFCRPVLRSLFFEIGLPRMQNAAQSRFVVIKLCAPFLGPG